MNGCLQQQSDDHRCIKTLIIQWAVQCSQLPFTRFTFSYLYSFQVIHLERILFQPAPEETCKSSVLNPLPLSSTVILDGQGLKQFVPALLLHLHVWWYCWISSLHYPVYTLFQPTCHIFSTSPKFWWVTWTAPDALIVFTTILNGIRQSELSKRFRHHIMSDAPQFFNRVVDHSKPTVQRFWIFAVRIIFFLHIKNGMFNTG